MTKKPIIGLTLDHENDQKYSAFPYFALRENYINSVIAAGGTPILLPFDNSAIDEYLNIISGVIVTGGNFDISPEIYGESTQHDKTTLKVNRTNFEVQITKQALAKKMPLFGICGGMQLLNVICGGTLIQHIPDEVPNHEQHEAKPYDAAAHDIKIKADTKLSTLTNDKVVGVNSSHHQAVKKIGNGLTASGVANDGVIEAIEDSNAKFTIGVQWHPEYSISELDKNLFTNFIESASAYR